MTRRPGPSLQVRLAASYAAFVVVVGVVLFAIGLFVLRFVPDAYGYDMSGLPVPSRSDLLEVFVRYALWSLAGLAVLGVGGGWLLAGWMLRPLRRIAEVVSRTRVGALDARIRLPGRRDELTDAADAFDGMLDRIERSVAAERRFAANASHELRTPLAVTRTLLEVAAADPAGRDVELLLARLSATNERSIAITEATLALARVETDALDRETLDLAAVVREVLADAAPDAGARGIRIASALAVAPVSAHPALVRQLATNLVRNAIVHNVEGGTVDVATVAAEGRSALTVVNGGPLLDDMTVSTLTEPFVRGSGRVHRSGGGAGLGLAIARAITDAHGGALLLAARPEGGLTATAVLPAP